MRNDSPVLDGTPLLTTESLSRAGVSDLPHALQYLEMINRKKPQYSRLIPWLLQFELIPTKPSQWPSAFSALATSYASHIAAYCGDSSRESLEPLVESIVPRDLSRSVGMCSTIFATLGIDETFFDRPLIRFLRIFVILSKIEPGLKYFQGYDRFAYICAAVSSTFCLRLGLSVEIAEAVCCSVTHFFLTKLAWRDPPTEKAILNSGTIFADVDTALRRFFPATASALDSQHLQPTVYALKWIMVLFAENHPIEDLLLVWDFIVLNVGNAHSYIVGLVIGQLNQIQIGMDLSETIQRIQNKQEFIIDRLIADADRVVGKRPISTQVSEKRGGVSPILVFAIPLFIVIIGAYLLYHQLR
jgi:hypothetical protein